MTCKEKLAIERPEKIKEDEYGECIGCPHTYGYRSDRPEYCHNEKISRDIRCIRCWNREIEAVIKDSGDRTEFSTGAVRDMREGKGRCDLMPLEVVAELLEDPDARQIIHDISSFQEYKDTDFLKSALLNFARRYECENFRASLITMLLGVAKHFEEGAKKYGENNWQKGIPVNCYIDSAIRHYLKWLRGDTDEPHDRAFVWNLMCCIWEVDYRDKENG